MSRHLTLAQKKDGVEKFVLSPKFQAALKQACATINPQTVARAYLTAINKVPKLLECSPTSWAGAILGCAQMGLIPDGRQAALVPFGDTATLIPMYQGLTQLAYRSGMVCGIHTAVVYEGERFFHVVQNGAPTIHHEPLDKMQGECDIKLAKGAYAIIQTTTGGAILEWMPWVSVLAIKARSRGASRRDSPWNHPRDWVWMARKTALRAALKQAPQSYELTKALDADDATETGEPQDLPVPAEFREIDLEKEARIEDLRLGLEQAATRNEINDLWETIEAENLEDELRDAYERAVAQMES